MNDTTIELSAADTDKLLACADGNSALLYLHIMRNGSFSLTKAARELKRSETEIALAADTLRRLGMLEGAPPLRSEEMPEYTSDDIIKRARTDSSFEGVVFEAQKALGKLLSTGDLRLLFGIYDHLGIPAEVILLLINHCIETYRAQNGEGRMPTMRYIEKEAWYWADMEILSLDAAEEHIRREKQKKELSEQVKAVLQIRARGLTVSESKYIDSWLSLGFSPEALAVAYDRTVLGTGKLTWKYMDRIVQSWYEKKLFTPEEIAAGDARYAKKPPSGAPEDSDRRDMENMRRMYEHMKNKEK